MVTLTSIENALKSVYLDTVSEQLNTKTNPLLANINRTSRDVWGKDIKKLVHYGLNGGVCAGSETGTLPVSGENYYEQFTLPLINLYGTIEISDKAIRASQNSAGAFVNLLNAEMESLIKASHFNLGRMLYGDGKGILATTIDDSSGRSVTVDNTNNLVEGMIVDIYIGDNEKVVECGRILSIDREKNIVYFSGTIGEIKKGSFITIQNSYNKELVGLGSIFKDSGNLYGLSRETHKWLIPYMIKNVGEINDNIIQKAIDEICETSGSEINFIVCSAGVKRALLKHLATYNSTLDTIDINNGYKGLSYNGIPIVVDRFCPKGTMYLLNTNDFTMHQLCDWTWLESGNGTILQQVPNKPVYTATLVKYANLICDKPCGQGMLSGIIEK